MTRHFSASLDSNRLSFFSLGNGNNSEQAHKKKSTANSNTLTRVSDQSKAHIGSLDELPTHYITTSVLQTNIFTWIDKNFDAIFLSSS